MPDLPSFEFAAELHASTASASGAASRDEPFRLLILGDFSGRGSRGVVDLEGLPHRKVIRVDRDNLDEVLRRLAPTLEVRIGSTTAESSSIAFAEIDDFHPDRLFDRLDVFEHMRRTRRRLQNRDTFAEAAAELAPPTDEPPPAESPTAEEEPETAGDPGAAELLDDLLAADAAAEAPAANPMDAVIREIVAPYIEPAADPRQAEYVAAVDAGIAAQMRAMLHDPHFQRLEAAWRGLDFLVRRLETDTKLRLELVDVAPAELAADLTAPEESGLLRLLSEASEAHPLAAIVSLIDVEATADGVGIAHGLAGIGGALGAPLVVGADARWCGVSSFGDSADPSDWNEVDDDDLAATWTQFRSTTGANASLLAPRFLLRLPYGRKTSPIESFDFEERSSTSTHGEFAWGSGALLAALLLGTRFSQAGWALSVTESLEVDGLPLYSFQDEDGDWQLLPCAEAWLTERGGQALAERGLSAVFSIRERDAVLVPGLRDAGEGHQPLRGRWG